MNKLGYSIDAIKAVMFDLDGTIYYGSKIIPGTNETIGFFRNKGIKVFEASVVCVTRG